MFKNIKVKKSEFFISAILALVFIANASYAFAATLNNDSNDHATLRTMNYTIYGDTNQNWSTSVSGNAGETISFAVYYHNTSSETATDVRVRFTPQSTGTGTNHQFNGTVWASNAIAVSGSSNVFISSSQSMNYIPGTVIWRPNQTVSGSQSFLYGQNGTEIFTSAGLRLGDIAPGWSTQGSVVLRFQISNSFPVPNPVPTADIKANSSDNSVFISYNTSATISWTSSNVTSCTVSPTGYVGTSGSQSTGNLTNSQTYTLNCSGSNGSVSDSVTVNVGQQPQQNFPFVTVSANPTFINQGGSSVISWNSTNATSCSASGGWFGSKALSGSEIVSLSQTTSYSITCSNSSGTAFNSAMVTVNQQQFFPSVTLIANPSVINVGNNSVLTWNSQNANYCIASGGWSGSKSISGSETVAPSVSTNYTINCYNNSGQNSAAATIYVNGQQTFPTVNLSVNPSFIQNGQSTLLVWSSYNATSCYASGGWYGNKSLSGSENISPSLNTVYTITCSNSAGSVSDTDTVTVTTPIIPLPIVQTFNAACAVSPEVARVGQIVAFAAGYAGGTAPYTYSWNQDISGIGLTRAVTFRTTGTKTARVIITDGIGRTAQGTCSVRINPVVVVVVPPPPRQKPPIINTVAETCKCEGQGVQLIDASNKTNGKDRSLAASLILDENGKPTSAGLIMIWYFVILFTVAVGAWIYYLISKRRE